jgi:hypothetical protein
VLGPGARPGGGEQQQSGSFEHAADDPGIGAELVDDGSVEIHFSPFRAWLMTAGSRRFSGMAS